MHNMLDFKQKHSFTTRYYSIAMVLFYAVAAWLEAQKIYRETTKDHIS